MIGYRAPAPREVIVSRTKLESLLWDNRDKGAVVEFAGDRSYLAIDGVVYVAVLGGAS